MNHSVDFSTNLTGEALRAKVSELLAEYGTVKFNSESGFSLTNFHASSDYDPSGAVNKAFKPHEVIVDGRLRARANSVNVTLRGRFSKFDAGIHGVLLLWCSVAIVLGVVLGWYVLSVICVVALITTILSVKSHGKRMEATLDAVLDEAIKDLEFGMSPN